MSESAGQAVFLSYASQDAETARRLCEALRSAGVEVWFDQSELVGGDAWDQKIRRQIKACALFIPVISAASQARREGYFRIEWKLAAQRTQALADGTPFLLPVVVDGIRDTEALVPEEFRSVQWTRLTGGETTPAFVGQIKRLLAPAEVGQASSLPSSPNAGRMPALPQTAAPKSSFPVALVAGLGVAVLALIGYIALRPAANETPSLAAANPESAARRSAPPTAEKVAPVPDEKSAPSDKSIAVLPFSNMSDDKGASAFFSDGVQEDILTNLANIREFRVVPRTSVEQYRGTTKKIAQIAQELRVAYILEGSVRRAGEQVRVTGKLLNARTEESVWAKAYDRNLTNIFSIQAELATDIAQALKTALSPEEKTLVERRPTQSTAAYEQFLKAREVRRGFGPTVANAQTMEPFLLEAVRLDPNYAAAYAELVYVYTIDNTAAGRQERLAKAQAAVDQARRLAPDSPEVMLALGDFYLGSGDAGRALEHYDRFGRLRPKDPDYLGRLAETYQRQGKGMEQKTWELRKQLEDVDPGNLANLYRTVNLLVGGRRYAEAIAVQRRIWARVPDNLEARHYIGWMTFLLDGSTQLQDQFWSEIRLEAWDRGIVWRRRWLRMQGKLEEAVSLDLAHPLAGDVETINLAVIHAAREDVAAARARLGDLPEKLRRRVTVGNPGEKNAELWVRLGTLEAVLGNRAEALRCAKRAIELSPTPRVPTSDLARLYAWAGDKDSALTELGQLLLPDSHPDLAGGTSVHALKRDPNFFPLQGDPRFEALLNDPKNHAPRF